MPSPTPRWLGPIECPNLTGLWWSCPEPTGIPPETGPLLVLGIIIILAAGFLFMTALMFMVMD